jgi:hypothetical protein
LAPTAFFINIELGNLELKRGEREAALASYRAALNGAPDSPSIRQPIEDQIHALANSSTTAVPPLRNPFLE